MGNYRITLKGSSFVIKHNAGAAIDVCMTEKEAKQKMELCQQDDLMLDAGHGRESDRKSFSPAPSRSHQSRTTSR